MIITNLNQIPKDMSWSEISAILPLSEIFIEDHSDKVNWNLISWYQPLSEEFMEKHIHELNWSWICRNQNLSEVFLMRYIDKIDWAFASVYQKLSEKFMDWNSDFLRWEGIAKYQNLSEYFIEKNIDRLNMESIGKYQFLSPEFQKKYSIKEVEPWLYKSAKEKKEVIESTGLYECFEDYFLAYKHLRPDGFSIADFKEQYFTGDTYHAHADHTSTSSSFGLSASTKRVAQAFKPEKIILVKINYSDLACVTQQQDVIRCKSFTVLKEIDQI